MLLIPAGVSPSLSQPDARPNSTVLLVSEGAKGKFGRTHKICCPTELATGAEVSMQQKLLGGISGLIWKLGEEVIDTCAFQKAFNGLHKLRSFTGLLSHSANQPMRWLIA